MFNLEERSIIILGKYFVSQLFWKQPSNPTPQSHVFACVNVYMGIDVSVHCMYIHVFVVSYIHAIVCSDKGLSYTTLRSRWPRWIWISYSRWYGPNCSRCISSYVHPICTRVGDWGEEIQRMWGGVTWAAGNLQDKKLVIEGDSLEVIQWCGVITCT